MDKVEISYRKTLADKSECILSFSIEAEKKDGNVPEILSLFAKMSRAAYINLGNKMRYGTADQEKTKSIADLSKQISNEMQAENSLSGREFSEIEEDFNHQLEMFLKSPPKLKL